MAAKKPATKKTAAKTVKAQVIDLRAKPRKSKPYAASMCEIAAAAARFGATDQEIADELGVAVRTYYRYLARHEPLRAAIAGAKGEANKRAERTLYARAIGYRVRREKLFNLGDGRVVRAEYEEEILPDVTALAIWLNNRDPDRWKQKRDSAGPGDAPGGDLVESPRQIIEHRFAIMARVIHEAAGEGEPMTLDLQAIKAAVKEIAAPKKSEEPAGDVPVPAAGK